MADMHHLKDLSAQQPSANNVNDNESSQILSKFHSDAEPLLFMREFLDAFFVAISSKPLDSEGLLSLLLHLLQDGQFIDTFIRSSGLDLLLDFFKNHLIPKPSSSASTFRLEKRIYNQNDGSLSHRSNNRSSPISEEHDPMAESFRFGGLKGLAGILDSEPRDMEHSPVPMMAQLPTSKVRAMGSRHLTPVSSQPGSLLSSGYSDSSPEDHDPLAMSMGRGGGGGHGATVSFDDRNGPLLPQFSEESPRIPKLPLSGGGSLSLAKLSLNNNLASVGGGGAAGGHGLVIPKLSLPTFDENALMLTRSSRRVHQSLPSAHLSTLRLSVDTLPRGRSFLNSLRSSAGNGSVGGGVNSSVNSDAQYSHTPLESDSAFPSSRIMTSRRTAKEELSALATKLGELFMASDLTALISRKRDRDMLAAHKRKPISMSGFVEQEDDKPRHHDSGASTPTYDQSESLDIDSHRIQKPPLFSHRIKVLEALAILFKHPLGPSSCRSPLHLMLWNMRSMVDRNEEELGLVLRVAAQCSLNVDSSLFLDFSAPLPPLPSSSSSSGSSSPLGSSDSMMDLELSSFSRYDLFLCHWSSHTNRMLMHGDFDAMELVNHVTDLSKYLREAAISRLSTFQAATTCLSVLFRIHSSLKQSSASVSGLGHDCDEPQQMALTYHFLSIVNHFLSMPERHPTLQEFLVFALMDHRENMEWLQDICNMALADDDFAASFDSIALDFELQFSLLQLRCCILQHCQLLIALVDNQPLSFWTRFEVHPLRAPEHSHLRIVENISVERSAPCQLLAKLDFLVHPSDGIALELLSAESSSSSWMHIHRPLHLELLKLLNAIFGSKHCPFLSHETYANAYVRFLFLNFVKLYIIPAESLPKDQCNQVAQFATSYLQVLLAISSNKSPAVVAKFRQLHVVSFLTREMQLEFEMLHAPSAKAVMQQQQKAKQHSHQREKELKPSAHDDSKLSNSAVATGKSLKLASLPFESPQPSYDEDSGKKPALPSNFALKIPVRAALPAADRVDVNSTPLAPVPAAAPAKLSLPALGKIVPLPKLNMLQVNTKATSLPEGNIAQFQSEDVGEALPEDDDKDINAIAERESWSGDDNDDDDDADDGSESDDDELRSSSEEDDEPQQKMEQKKPLPASFIPVLAPQGMRFSSLSIPEKDLQDNMENDGSLSAAPLSHRQRTPRLIQSDADGTIVIINSSSCNNANNNNSNNSSSSGGNAGNLSARRTALHISGLVPQNAFGSDPADSLSSMPIRSPRWLKAQQSGGRSSSPAVAAFLNSDRRADDEAAPTVVALFQKSASFVPESDLAQPSNRSSLALETIRSASFASISNKLRDGSSSGHRSNRPHSSRSSDDSGSIIDSDDEERYSGSDNDSDKDDEPYQYPQSAPPAFKQTPPLSSSHLPKISFIPGLSLSGSMTKDGLPAVSAGQHLSLPSQPPQVQLQLSQPDSKQVNNDHDGHDENSSSSISYSDSDDDYSGSDADADDDDNAHKHKSVGGDDKRIRPRTPQGQTLPKPAMMMMLPGLRLGASETKDGQAVQGKSIVVGSNNDHEEHHSGGDNDDNSDDAPSTSTYISEDTGSSYAGSDNESVGEEQEQQQQKQQQPRSRPVSAAGVPKFLQLPPPSNYAERSLLSGDESYDKPPPTAMSSVPPLLPSSVSPLHSSFSSANRSKAHLPYNDDDDNQKRPSTAISEGVISSLSDSYASSFALSASEAGGSSIFFSPNSASAANANTEVSSQIFFSSSASQHNHFSASIQGLTAIEQNLNLHHSKMQLLLHDPPSQLPPPPTASSLQLRPFSAGKRLHQPSVDSIASEENYSPRFESASPDNPLASSIMTPLSALQMEDLEEEQEREHDDEANVDHDDSSSSSLSKYEAECQRRLMYRNKEVHATAVCLLLSLLLTPHQTLESLYVDSFPLNNRMQNIPFVLHLHLNHDKNNGIAERSMEIGRSLGQGMPILLRLLCTRFFAEELYTNKIRMGSGAFGAVYSADASVPESTVKQVAIKVMERPHDVHDRCVLHDIFNEILILQRFQGDPRICRLYDFGVDDSCYFIVMRLYKGSLKDWRKQHGPHLADVPFDYASIQPGYVPASLPPGYEQHCQQSLPLYLSLFGKILECSRLLFESKVNHYDIKCDNFLIDPTSSSPMSHESDLPSSAAPAPSKQPKESEGASSLLLLPPLGPSSSSSSSSSLPSSAANDSSSDLSIVVADFGESLVYDREQESYTMRNKGTEFIKSPEMLNVGMASQKTRATYDRRKRVGAGSSSDIWSLGCLLYELVTGEFLFFDPDWIRFFLRVTSTSNSSIGHDLLLTSDKRAKLCNTPVLIDLLEFILIRDPFRRPSIYDVIHHFNQLTMGYPASFSGSLTSRDRQRRQHQQQQQAIRRQAYLEAPYNKSKSNPSSRSSSPITAQPSPRLLLSSQPSSAIGCIESILSKAFSSDSTLSSISSSSSSSFAALASSSHCILTELMPGIYISTSPSLPSSPPSSSSSSVDCPSLFTNGFTHIVHASAPSSPSISSSHFVNIHLFSNVQMPLNQLVSSWMECISLVRSAIGSGGKVLISSTSDYCLLFCLVWLMHTYALSSFEAYLHLRNRVASSFPVHIHSVFAPRFIQQHNNNGYDFSKIHNQNQAETVSAATAAGRSWTLFARNSISLDMSACQDVCYKTAFAPGFQATGIPHAHRRTARTSSVAGLSLSLTSMDASLTSTLQGLLHSARPLDSGRTTGRTHRSMFRCLCGLQTLGINPPFDPTLSAEKSHASSPFSAWPHLSQELSHVFGMHSSASASSSSSSLPTWALTSPSALIGPFFASSLDPSSTVVEHKSTVHCNRQTDWKIFVCKCCEFPAYATRQPSAVSMELEVAVCTVLQAAEGTALVSGPSSNSSALSSSLKIPDGQDLRPWLFFVHSSRCSPSIHL